MSSWEDRLYDARPGVERALVYLERAQGRGSKNAAANDIDDAIAEANVVGILDLRDLLGRYSLDWSFDDLIEAAERFAAELRAGADFSVPIELSVAERRATAIENALKALTAAKRKSARLRAWAAAEEAAAWAEEAGIASAKSLLGSDRWPELGVLRKALEDLA